MILLVDVGNSRLKWAVVEAGLIRSTVFIDYRQSGFSSKLRECWCELPPPGQLAIAAVSSNEVTELLVDLAKALWPTIDVVVPRPSLLAFGVRNAYSQPESLGVDRWLALIAAHRYYPGDTCVVDCGTAITIDFIAKDGVHSGGLIGPGLWLMKKALALNTAALPFTETEADTGLAIATEMAINNGTLSAVVGMVEAVIRRQAKADRLIVCGGDADVVVRHLSLPAIVDESLVFKGLLNYCRVDESQ